VRERGWGDGGSRGHSCDLCAIRAEAQGRGSDPRPVLATGEEAVAFARVAGDDFVLALALNNLGSATMSLLGDDERATAYFEESLELRRRLGDISRIALSLENVASIALRADDISRAATLFAEAAEIATAIGDKRHICFAQAGLGWIAYRECRWQEAGAHMQESLRLAKELGMRSPLVEAILALAGIAAATGNIGRAARLAGAAEFHGSLFLEPTFHENDIESAKASCEPETWKQALAEGRVMSLDEAADYALSSGSAPSKPDTATLA